MQPNVTLSYRLIIQAFLLFLSFPAYNQWHLKNADFGIKVNDLAVSGNTLVTCTQHRSDNFGNLWGDMPPRTASFYGLSHVVTRDGKVYIAGSGALYTGSLTEPGWDTLIIDGLHPRCMLMAGEYLFIGAGTDNHAVVRFHIPSGVWDIVLSLNGYAVNSRFLAVTGDTLYAVGEPGLYKSTDFGDNWTKVGSINSLVSVCANADTLFVINNGYSVRRSVDGGLNWTPAGSQMQELFLAGNDYFLSGKDGKFYRRRGALGVLELLFEGDHILDVEKTDDRLFLAGWLGCYRSADDGEIFEFVSSGIGDPVAAGNIPNNLENHGEHWTFNISDILLISGNEGDTWRSVPVGVAAQPVGAPIRLGDWYFLLQTDGLYASQGDWLSWNKLPATGLPADSIMVNGTPVAGLLTIDTALIAWAAGNYYVSTDGGLNFQSGNAPCPVWGQMVYQDGRLYRQGLSDIYVSNFPGDTWTNISQGLTFPYNLSKLTASNGKLYVLNDKNLRRFDQQTQKWTAVVALNDIDDFAAMGDTIAMKYGAYTLYLTLDGGSTLKRIYTGSQYINQLALSKHTLMVFFGLNRQLLATLPLGEAAQIITPGMVFLDANSNGFRDGNENPYTGMVFHSKLSGTFAASDSLGNFTVLSHLAGDTLRPVLPNPYFSTAPPFYILDGIQGASMVFALQIANNIPDLRVTATNPTVFRPGFSSDLVLHVKNNGTIKQDAELRLVPDPKLAFMQATPAPTTISGDTLIWEMPSLELFASAGFHIRIHTPSVVPIGSDITIVATVSSLAIDATPKDNIYVLHAVTVGSYDPNDKQVEPSAYTDLDLMAGLPLIYTVRFQNTGTYPATFVRIADTLSPKLDIGTLQFLSGSHPCTFTLRGAGVADFFFDNIFLPDAASDEAGSHGFVKFSVKPHRDLAVGDEVSNKALIYFDFNDPIITNSIETHISKGVSAFAKYKPLPLSLHPNPAVDHLHLSTGVSDSDHGRIKIFNVAGRLVLDQPASGESLTIRIKHLPAGAYHVFWETGKNRFYGIFIKA